MKKTALMLAIVISSIITGSCATTDTRYQSDPLPLPSRPVLPSVSAEEFAQVPQATAWKIKERERLRREYAEELETIIKATHQEQQ